MVVSAVEGEAAALKKALSGRANVDTATFDCAKDAQVQAPSHSGLVLRMRCGAPQTVVINVWPFTLDRGWWKPFSKSLYN